jgi:hypothetical protein
MRYLLLALLFPLTVAAEQFAVAVDGGDSIELHDRVHGKCGPGVKEAVYVYKAGMRLAGCWKYIADRDSVFVVFEDGDAFLVKSERFTWKAGKKPATL